MLWSGVCSRVVALAVCLPDIGDGISKSECLWYIRLRSMTCLVTIWTQGSRSLTIFLSKNTIALEALLDLGPMTDIMEFCKCRSAEWFGGEASQPYKPSVSIFICITLSLTSSVTFRKRIRLTNRAASCILFVSVVAIPLTEVLRWPPRSLTWSTTGMVSLRCFQTWLASHCLVEECEAKRKHLLVDILAPMSMKYSCVRLLPSSKFLKPCSPMARMSISSASMRGWSPKASIMEIQGLKRAAMNNILNGHPCGMPHLRLWGFPSPPASELWYMALSWKLV